MDAEIDARWSFRVGLMTAVAFIAAATVSPPAEASYQPPERIWGNYAGVSVSGAGATRLFERPKRIRVA